MDIIIFGLLYFAVTWVILRFFAGCGGGDEDDV